uniref:hypothetical protein n=1 Tax=Arachnia propionica TaxID=1750 RepID=UPI0030C69B70
MVTDWVTGDRPVISPPVGYEFSYVSIPGEESRYNRHWFVSFGGNRDGRGVEIQGTGIAYSTRGETMEDFCDDNEAYWATPSKPVDRLAPRLIGDAEACGFRGTNIMYGMAPQEYRLLCRSDNCWEFKLEGDDGSGTVPGDLIAALDTVRFISPVESKPDFRLGELDVSPSASPSK